MLARRHLNYCVHNTRTTKDDLIKSRETIFLFYVPLKEQVGAERCNDPGGACAVLSVAYVRVKQFCSKAKAARRLSRSAQGAPGGDGISHSAHFYMYCVITLLYVLCNNLALE